MTKPTKSLCAQRRLRSAWASAQSDQSSLSAWGHSEDSDQTGRCPGWSESLLGAQSFCWFCHPAAQIDEQQRFRQACTSVHLKVTLWKTVRSGWLLLSVLSFARQIFRIEFLCVSWLLFASAGNTRELISKWLALANSKTMFLWCKKAEEQIRMVFDDNLGIIFHISP